MLRVDEQIVVVPLWLGCIEKSFWDAQLGAVGPRLRALGYAPLRFRDVGGLGFGDFGFRVLGAKPTNNKLV